ncbi:hypothetical protein ABZ570_15690 [Micromonospora sp. NPDC007271]|uniref:hypothetical protein n=1 Tax=Micromonospora sp. NPDC007271 TaxID=3154587 RepID=UPI0033E3D537
MLISTAAWRALIDAGVLVVPLDADHVELRCGAHRGVLKVVTSPAVLNPSDIAALKSRHRDKILLAVPSATSAVRTTIEAAGWSWLIDNGRHVTGLLQLAGQPIPIDSREAAAPAQRARPGRVPWGTLTLVRRLAGQPWPGQQQLAAVAGVSQPRVSQALAALAEQGLVQRTPAGWDVTNIDSVFDWWLRSYPGPGGIRSFWYGLEPPVKQAEAVVDVLTSSDAGRIAISGDVAADLIAPWRSPRRAVIYAQTGVDLASAGFTPAGDEEATVELIVPKDPGVWPGPTAEEALGRRPLADPLQILWDATRAPGPDADEATQRLRKALRDRRQRATGSQAA